MSPSNVIHPRVDIGPWCSALCARLASHRPRSATANKTAGQYRMSIIPLRDEEC